MTSEERITGFRREFANLLLKYKPSVEVKLGYYDDVENIEFSFEDKIAVSLSLYGNWIDVGDEQIDFSASQH